MARFWSEASHLVTPMGYARHRQVNATVIRPEHKRGMKPSRHPRYARHRFPAEVISHAVWLCFRFPLSLRMVEEMLAARALRSAMRRYGNGR
jgi:hypothetical protein